jgi:hypothetical protein
MHSKCCAIMLSPWQSTTFCRRYGLSLLCRAHPQCLRHKLDAIFVGNPACGVALHRRWTMWATGVISCKWRNCNCQMLVSQSDNNMKLIVLDRLQVGYQAQLHESTLITIYVAACFACFLCYVDLYQRMVEAPLPSLNARFFHAADLWKSCVHTASVSGHGSGQWSSPSAPSSQEL